MGVLEPEPGLWAGSFPRIPYLALGATCIVGREGNGTRSLPDLFLALKLFKAVRGANVHPSMQQTQALFPGGVVELHIDKCRGLKDTYTMGGCPVGALDLV